MTGPGRESQRQSGIIGDGGAKMTEAARLYEELLDAVGPSIGGHEGVFEMLTVALLARGHVLVGGWPTSETAQVASAFAAALGLSRQRIRLTPDARVADILGQGASVVDDGESSGRPLSANILHADDFNRAPPRVQSTIVEAMDGGRALDGGEAAEIPRPFLVLATLNPVESDEVYGLPTSYRNRFLFWLRMGDLEREAARELLDWYDQGGSVSGDAVEPIAGPEDVLQIQEAVEATYVGAAIKEYIVDAVLATREHPDVEYGAPTRASLKIMRAGKSYAALQGRDYVIPDDVRAVAALALAPQLVLTTEAEIDDVDPAAAARDVLDTVTPPGAEFEVDGPPVEERQPE